VAQVPTNAQELLEQSVALFGQPVRAHVVALHTPPIGAIDPFVGSVSGDCQVISSCMLLLYCADEIDTEVDIPSCVVLCVCACNFVSHHWKLHQIGTVAYLGYKR
jgi:hypothetical protein